MQEIEKLLSFIDQCPTPFQMVENTAKMLGTAGFVQLNESDHWQLAAGGKYFVTRNGSAILAFTLPDAGWAGAHIVVQHGDSPCFKLKQNAVTETAGVKKLNVEVYGGLNLASWLDRPLSVAGRVMIKTEEGLYSLPVDAKKDLAVIPSVAIHQNRTINDGCKYNPQIDLQPIFAKDMGIKELIELLIAPTQLKKEQVAAAELYLYSRQKGFVFGLDDAFYSAPRIDDLACVYTTLQGFLTAKQNGVGVWCVLDNEEVGSTTKQGACAPFVAKVLKRACLAAGGDEESFERSLASSFLLSADNAHAVHPNKPELSDSLNAPILGGGVVLKHNANQKYTTDAVSAAVVMALCEKAGVKLQHFANRSDMPGGSTLGNLATTQLDINAADIGLPQLSMHSACETACVEDAAEMTKAAKAFYEQPIFCPADGKIKLI